MTDKELLSQVLNPNNGAIGKIPLWLETKIRAATSEKPKPDLIQVLKNLLECCELNLDEMEEETRQAIENAQNAILLY